MVRRPMTRLAVTAAAAGTICALGATAASAAPHAGWGSPSTVPGAITNDSPGVSSITFPVANGQGQIVGWRGRGTSGPIFYKYEVPGLNKGHWSATGRVPGSTSSAPAFGSYRDPFGAWAVLAVWTGPADHHIWFSQGETKATGKIDWTKPAFLPKTVANTDTSKGPAVLFPGHTYSVVIGWEGPGTHVRFVIGKPHHRSFIFGDSRIVPGPHVTKDCSAAPCTGNTPAFAEVNTSATSGTIYVFWTRKSGRAVLYSTTADTAANLAKPTFAGPVTVPGASTLAGPAASDTGVNGFGPLLLAYKAPLTTAVRFQTLASGVWSAGASVPGTHTAVAPALLFNELASTTPATDGNIILRDFTP